MNFDLEEIKKLANLSKLKLREEEELEYGKQISSVLEYVKMLDEINLEDDKIKTLIEETKMSDLKNVWREDNSLPWDEKELKLALSQGDVEDSYLKVKKVL